MEIFEQNPSTDTIYVPMGDTALIRGVAAAAKQLSPDVCIVGVQAERAPSYFLSWREGRAVPTDTCDTIADGLATRTPEEANVTEIRHLVDKVMLVGEAEMLAAIRYLSEREGVLAEPAGAAATAAFQQSVGDKGNRSPCSSPEITSRQKCGKRCSAHRTNQCSSIFHRFYRGY